MPSASKRAGRPVSAYIRLLRDGKKVPGELIKEWICKLIAGNGFPCGYKKLTVCLRQDHGLIINDKKVYRLWKEVEILRPQRKVLGRHPRCVAKRTP